MVEFEEFAKSLENVPKIERLSAPVIRNNQINYEDGLKLTKRMKYLADQNNEWHHQYDLPLLTWLIKLLLLAFGNVIKNQVKVHKPWENQCVYNEGFETVLPAGKEKYQQWNVVLSTEEKIWERNYP